MHVIARCLVLLCEVCKAITRASLWEQNCEIHVIAHGKCYFVIAWGYQIAEIMCLNSFWNGRSRKQNSKRTSNDSLTVLHTHYFVLEKLDHEIIWCCRPHISDIITYRYHYFSESFCATSHNFMHMECFYVDKILMFNCSYCPLSSRRKH